MPKPKYVNQIRHLIAESSEAMITEEQFRYHLRELIQKMSGPLIGQQGTSILSKASHIYGTAQDVSKDNNPDPLEIEMIAEELEQLDTEVNQVTNQYLNDNGLSTFKTVWNQYNFNLSEKVPYKAFLPEDENVREKNDEPQENADQSRGDAEAYQGFIDKYAIKTSDDDIALKNLALCMVAFKMQKEGKPFDEQNIILDADKLEKSKPFQDAFEQRIEGLDFDLGGIGNDLAKEYLEDKNLIGAYDTVSKFMKAPIKENEDPENEKEKDEPEINILSEAKDEQVREEVPQEKQPAENQEPEDLTEYFPGFDPGSRISRRGLMQTVRDVNWKIRAETEMAAYLAGANTAQRDLKETVNYGEAMNLINRIHAQTHRLPGSIDKPADIEGRIHKFPKQGEEAAEEKTGSLDVYLLRIIDHMDLPPYIDKKQKKQELVNRIKQRGMDYREYYELTGKVPADGTPLKENDAYVYEYKASDKDFSLMAAVSHCVDGHGADKIPNAAGFKAEVARLKEDPLVRTVMGNKRTVEKLRRGDADGVVADVNAVKKKLTFSEDKIDTAKENARKVLNAMERMTGKDTSSPEWKALKKSVKDFVDQPQGKSSARYAADVLVNVEKFTKGKKNFQRDKVRQECVNLALDALKECVPDARNNPAAKPLIDRFSQVRGRGRELDLSQHGVNSVRSNKLRPAYVDVWNDLETKAKAQDDQERKFLLTLAMMNEDDPRAVSLKYRGRQALLDGMFPNAQNTPDWRLTPLMEKDFEDAAKFVERDTFLAKKLNNVDDPQRQTAAKFTAFIASNPVLREGYQRMRLTDMQNDYEASNKLFLDYEQALKSGTAADMRKVTDTLMKAAVSSSAKKEPGPAPSL